MSPKSYQNTARKLRNVTVLTRQPQEPEYVRRLSSDLVGRMAKIRVLLADDHELILARVKALLGDDFEIVNAVSNGRDAVREVQRLRPDILIIDISMPVLNGLDAVSELRSSSSETKVVILTVHEDPEFVSTALHLGASGYVVKEQIATDLVPAIQACVQGGSYISKSIQR